MKNKNIQPDNIDAIEPKNNYDFFGNSHAEKTLLDSYNSGKMPNAWLICGQKGIGKATLAYRFARFLLTDNKDAFSLHVPPSDYASEQISNNSNPNLMVLESEIGDDSATNAIKVEDTRKINSFLRMTASEDKHRIVLIDSADQLNSSSANAILKLLEEPPKQTIFLLVSHSPGKLLPTIRSRCRTLKMQNMSDSEIRKTISLHISDDEMHHPDVDKAIILSKGSVGTALEIYHNNGIIIYDKIMTILDGYPSLNFDIIHNLAADISKKAVAKQWDIFTYLITEILSDIIKSLSTGQTPESIKLYTKNKKQLLVDFSLESLLKIWDKNSSLIKNVERINLDKRAVLINIFSNFSR